MGNTVSSINGLYDQAAGIFINAINESASSVKIYRWLHSMSQSVPYTLINVNHETINSHPFLLIEALVSYLPARLHDPCTRGG